MKKAIFLVLFLFSIILISCSEDESTSPEGKTFDVEYRITSTTTVDTVRYMTHSGDTMTALNVNSGWSYKWTAKGKSGDKTYIKLAMNNRVGVAAYQILANGSALFADSLSGISFGNVSVEYSTTLPY